MKPHLLHVVAVLITDASEDSIATVIGRVQDKLNLANARSGRTYELSMSIGIVPGSSTQTPDLEALLQRADELVYQAKAKKVPHDRDPAP